jgi:hypothetical protein
VNEHVILGNKDIEESSGGGILEAYMEAHAWEDFAAAIKQSVAGAPETPFEISARIATGKNTRITMPTR